MILVSFECEPQDLYLRPINAPFKLTLNLPYSNQAASASLTTQQVLNSLGAVRGKSLPEQLR